jgi:hypothetical protein
MDKNSNLSVRDVRKKMVRLGEIMTLEALRMAEELDPRILKMTIFQI